MVIVEPSFLAEISTPSSFCPAAEATEPDSNWSADAGTTKPIAAIAATLASNLPRTLVMPCTLVIVFLLLSFPRFGLSSRFGIRELEVNYSAPPGRAPPPVWTVADTGTVRTYEMIASISFGLR